MISRKVVFYLPFYVFWIMDGQSGNGFFVYSQARYVQFCGDLAVVAKGRYPSGHGTAPEATNKGASKKRSEKKTCKKFGPCCKVSSVLISESAASGCMREGKLD